ncbi:hypothetical protein V473_07190 [Sphingobium cupriresistens LL01]|uniref:Uncharacterized protein n=1 Tax=Sphingobium cupriresistens LL01 TaxID=1420583 RepID=A0A0J7Y5W3_9SPHN|nr:hypothetical protein V473_07190 [Sphingobium cupriresistens LL01]
MVLAFREKRIGVIAASFGGADDPCGVGIALSHGGEALMQNGVLFSPFAALGRERIEALNRFFETGKMVHLKFLRD